MDILNELEFMTDQAQNGEYDPMQQPEPARAHAPRPAGNPRRQYLVKLEGALHSPRIIQEIAGLHEPPQVMEGHCSEGIAATFCLINGRAKAAILASPLRGATHPTFIWINKTHKMLSTYSMAPVLGLDADPTLPHHRADGATHTFLPVQDQYPVWYFFYGSLADPVFLAQKLGLAGQADLRAATIRGGIIRMWGGKYKALVDGPSSALVHGMAYQVPSKEAEEQPLYDETEQYEVVRCEAHLDGSAEVVQALTFRFVGALD